MKSNSLLSYTFITFGLIFFSNVQPTVSAAENHIVCNYPINYLSDESYPESAVNPLNPIKGIVSDKEQFIHIRNTCQTGNSGGVQYDFKGYNNKLISDRIYSKTDHGIVDSVNPLLPYDRFRNLYSSCKSGNGACEFLPDTNTRNSEKSRELLSKPVNLRVDSLTLIAQWDKPRSILIYEDFEGPDFPPQGWQVQTENFTGWYATTDGSSSNFNIPPHTTYSVANDDMDNGDGCCDYLITPPVDLTGMGNYKLYFSSFYNASYNQLASIELSSDGGLTWILICNPIPSISGWNDLEVDLSQFSGETGLNNVLLAFHADDNGHWASGWAIDDVVVEALNDNFLGYEVFLDDSSIGFSDSETYTFTTLEYGQQYLAGVSALYNTGSSERDTISFINGYLAPPVNLNGSIPDLCDYAVLSWGQPVDESGSGNGVSGLIGYNIYRNGNLLEFVNLPDTSYYDFNLLPGFYNYYVTAMYDLSPYGNPDFIGESMTSDTAYVDFICCNILPFTESFNTGLFETNLWIADTENWTINGEYGNEPPSAEFSGLPSITDYSVGLTSDYMIATNISDGIIFLEFDLESSFFNHSGTEFLSVEVFDGTYWNIVFRTSNETDSDWEAVKIPITVFVRDRIFKVRFRAHGATTEDIQFWRVDNINIYRHCPPPEQTQVNINFPHIDQFLIQWDPPAGIGSGTEWFSWDNGVNSDGLGISSGGIFYAAARFTQLQLVGFEGSVLTKIRFFPRDVGQFEIKVWTGAGASQLVHSQLVYNLQVNQWNEVDLVPPVPIYPQVDELWIGYAITHSPSLFPAGVDSGPAVAGFGDLLSFDGQEWEPMSISYGLNHNFNIEGLLVSDKGTITLKPQIDPLKPDKGLRADVDGFSDSSASLNPALRSSGRRDLSGYNVYYFGEWVGFTEETYFIHEVATLQSKWCYTVTAVYGDCVSDSSNRACVYLDKIEKRSESSANIYPNPSNSVVNIELTNDISQLVVYNYVGQVVYEQVITKDKTIQLNVRNYEAGAYLIKFITNSGESFTRKVAVTH